jgi:GDPmannose 4,6-dehydratase
LDSSPLVSSYPWKTKPDLLLSSLVSHFTFFVNPTRGWGSQGISGQDGYYLSRILLKKGYLVHGLIRPSSRAFNLHTYKPEVRASLTIHYGDVLDFSCLLRILSNVEIDEIYHLAAQSHVGVSFTSPVYTSDVNALGTLRLLQIIVQLKLQKKIKLYNVRVSKVWRIIIKLTAL